VLAVPAVLGVIAVGAVLAVLAVIAVGAVLAVLAYLNARRRPEGTRRSVDGARPTEWVRVARCVGA